jgi:LAGLIDADG endonuclease
LRFQITQHYREEKLLISFISYFGCGRYFVRSNHDAGDFVIIKFSDLTEKVIPLLKKYPIHGVKALDFADFCKVVELMKNQKHLTAAGLEEIKKIKTGMNRGRAD